MNTNRDFKGIWIPKEIWLNQELTPLEKMYLVEMDSLDNGETGCYANNKHFQELFGQTSNNVSRIITNLKNKGWIIVDYEYSGKEIKKRIIKIVRDRVPKHSKNDNGVFSKKAEGYSKNDKKGILKSGEERYTIYENNNIDNIYNDQKQKFKKPTIEELKKYCEEKSLKVDCEYFYDYYEANGWTVGKNKMKDWQATLRNWNRRNNIEQKQEEPKKTKVYYEYI